MGQLILEYTLQQQRASLLQAPHQLEPPPPPPPPPPPLPTWTPHSCSTMGQRCHSLDLELGKANLVRWRLQWSMRSGKATDTLTVRPFMATKQKLVLELLPLELPGLIFSSRASFGTQSTIQRTWKLLAEKAWPTLGLNTSTSISSTGLWLFREGTTCSLGMRMAR